MQEANKDFIYHLNIMTEKLNKQQENQAASILYQQDGFPGHPADWQHCFALDAIVVGTVQWPAHAKVRYFHGVQIADKTVPSGKVSMNDVQRLQVLHARSDLRCHVDQTAVATEHTGNKAASNKSAKVFPDSNTEWSLICHQGLILAKNSLTSAERSLERERLRQYKSSTHYDG